jgi:hypothetical protein
MVRAWFETGLQPCLLLFALAVSARLAYLFQFHPTFESAYWSLSEQLVRTGTFTIDGSAVTDYEPLYPVFLAAARMLAGDRVILVQTLQAAVASLGAVFLYRLSLALTGSMRAATIGGVLFAVHPLLIRQASAASDLSLVTTVLVAFAYAFVSMRGVAGAAMAGAWIGLAVLTRSMTLPVLAGGVAALIVARRTILVLPFVFTAMALIAPFVMWNYTATGYAWPTRSGMNLYIGNSPYTSSLLPRDDLDLLQEEAIDVVARERPDLREDAPDYAAEADAFLGRRALGYMMERPLRTLREKVVNVGYLISPYLVPMRIATPDTRIVIGAGGVTVEHSESRPRSEVAAYAAATTFVLLTAPVGIYVRRRLLKHDAILWAIAATFVVVNAVYVPATRYVAPMLFVLLFYSGVAVAQLRSTR